VTGAAISCIFLDHFLHAHDRSVLGANALFGIYDPIFEREDRLHLQGCAQERLRLANAPALLQVFERVHDKVKVRTGDELV
jgi:hypothetical protein